MSTVYDTRRRCPMCRNHGLPCNDAVHGRVIDLIDPIVPLPTPTRPRRDPAGQARTLATVATIVLMLCAGLVAIGATALVIGTGDHPCNVPPCAPVQYATVPSAPPTLTP